MHFAISRFFTADATRRAGHVGFEVPKAIPVALAVILVTAAWLKTWQSMVQPAISMGLLGSFWFRAAEIETELVLGIAMVFRFRPLATGAAAMILFTVFAGVSLGEALGGAASCSCFGELAVSPWLTLVLDLAAIPALWFWRSSERRGLGSRAQLTGTPQRRRFWSGLAVGGLPTLALLMAGVSSPPGSAQEITEARGTVVLNPEGWAGQALPLLPLVDISPRISVGSWILILYRKGCPSCHEQIPAFLHSIRRAESDAERKTPVALIEVPGKEPDSSELSGLLPTFIASRLPADRHWIVQTPTFIRLEEGAVHGVCHDAEGALLLAHAQSGSAD